MSEARQHDSRYAKKRRGAPGPNSMHAMAELGDDGIWRVDGKPYQKPRRWRYLGRVGPGTQDMFQDIETGAMSY